MRLVLGGTFPLKALGNPQITGWAFETLGSAQSHLTELQKQELEFRTHQDTGTLVRSFGFKMSRPKE